MIVASAKDKSTRKPLFPAAWDNGVLLTPRVNAKKQNRPAFTDKQVSQIVERAEGQYRVLFAVLAASGLRISELLGLRIENVLDDCYRLRIIEENYAGRQEDRLKTANAERIVELHSSAAQLLRSHIDQRTSGFVFENKKGNALCATNILKRYLHPVLLGSDDARSCRAEGRRARLPPLSRRLSPHAELPGWSFEVLAQPERPVRRLCGGRSVSLGDEREDGNRLRDSFGSCTECTELYRRNENGGWSSRRSKCKELNLLTTGEMVAGVRFELTTFGL
jgi:Phage integrase family